MKLLLKQDFRPSGLNEITTTFEAIEYAEELNQFLKLLEVALSQKIKEGLENNLPKYGSFRISIYPASTYHRFGMIGNSSDDDWHISQYLRINSKSGKPYLMLEFAYMGDWKNAARIEFTIYRGTLYHDILSVNNEFPSTFMQRVIDGKVGTYIYNSYSRYGFLVNDFDDKTWQIAFKHHNFPLYKLYDMQFPDEEFLSIPEDIGLKL